MPSPVSRPARPRKILVVEDDEGVLDLVCTILETEGHIVDTATTSHAALRKARSRGYDLVILDLILPDADGVILHGKLKRLVPALGSKTIFMTGFTSKEPVIEYLKSLSSEFIHKPFKPEDLIRAVERLC